MYLELSNYWILLMKSELEFCFKSLFSEFRFGVFRFCKIPTSCKLQIGPVNYLSKEIQHREWRDYIM